mmetsp:Transcript_14621/g.18676  ORF Transcript_14621/g.18676 Transcript_14621/m.18676 type:complete len:853 (+) Transcript_14621:168-2726(+)
MHGKRSRPNRGSATTKPKGAASGEKVGPVPLTKPAHKPGTAPPGLPSSSPSRPPCEEPAGENYEMACRERFLFVLQSLAGQRIEVEMKNGTIYDGIFHTATPFPDQPCKVVLKATTTKVKGDKDESSITPGSTIIIQYYEVLQIHASCLDLRSQDSSKEENDKETDFLTDADISGKRMVREHGIEEVDHSWLAGDPADGGIEDDGEWKRKKGAPSWQGGGKGDAQWDQFEANKRLFNVESTFDENLYTTKLDTSKMTPEQIARAERLAREIEGVKSDNFHLAEERGQRFESDYTEEQRYGGVLRPEENSAWENKSAKNVYVPPALRGRNTSLSKKKDTEPPWREMNNEVPDSWDAEDSPAPVADANKEHPEGQNGHTDNEKPSVEENKKKNETSTSGPTAKDQEVVQNIIFELEKKQSEQSQSQDNQNESTPEASKKSNPKLESPLASQPKKAENKKQEIKTKTDNESPDKEKVKEPEKKKIPDKPKEKSGEKPALNPNAKSFSFNPKAKEFKPPAVDVEPPSQDPGATRQPAPLWIPGVGMVANTPGAGAPNLAMPGGGTGVPGLPAGTPVPYGALPAAGVNPPGAGAPGYVGPMASQPPVTMAGSGTATPVSAPQQVPSQAMTYPPQYQMGTPTAAYQNMAPNTMAAAMMTAQQMGAAGGVYGGMTLLQLQQQQQLRQAAMQAAATGNFSAAYLAASQQQAAMAYAAAAQQAQQAQAQAQQYLYQKQMAAAAAATAGQGTPQHQAQQQHQQFLPATPQQSPSPVPVHIAHPTQPVAPNVLPATAYPPPAAAVQGIPQAQAFPPSQPPSASTTSSPTPGDNPSPVPVAVPPAVVEGVPSNQTKDPKPPETT